MTVKPRKLFTEGAVVGETTSSTKAETYILVLTGVDEGLSPLHSPASCLKEFLSGMAGDGDIAGFKLSKAILA